MENNFWKTFSIILIVVLVVGAVIVFWRNPELSPNAGVIKVQQSKYGPEVYTKAEVDAKFAGVSGSCQYVRYKDGNYGDLTYLTMFAICKEKFGGFSPKIIVETELKSLYNKQNCSPSYTIFSKSADNLFSYTNDLGSVRMGERIFDGCNNVLFPDGSSNAGFSIETHKFYSGVLCCKN